MMLHVVIKDQKLRAFVKFQPLWPFLNNHLLEITVTNTASFAKP
jgi:hypothetical protein